MPSRGFTLLELLVSQAIVLVFLAGLTSVVAALMRQTQTELNVSDAQGRLRELSQLLLRDSQGLGGPNAPAGDVVTIVDGGPDGPDSFELFRRDESVCGGAVAIDPNGNVPPPWSVAPIDLDPGAQINLQCPFARAGCTPTDIQAQPAVFSGLNGSVFGGATSANSTSCNLTLVNPDIFLAAFNEQNDPDATSVHDAATRLNAKQVLFGTRFRYRVVHEVLERSINESPFEPVMDGVYDLQVERIYDDDGVITPVRSSSADPLPTGVAPTELVGVRIGLITVSRAPDGLSVPPPATFSNRSHTDMPAALRARRYRASFVFAAARNR